MAISRRTILKAGLGIGALGAAGIGYSHISKIPTKANIVITGGGAGGIGLANMLMRHLDGAKVTIVEPRDFHWYQPGQTLLLAGSYQQRSDVISPIEKYLDANIIHKKATVEEFLPDTNTVITSKGERLHYDYLIVSTGIELRYDMIEGMDTNLIGKQGVTSIYHSPEAGMASYQQAHQFLSQPGEKRAVFTRPQGAMKCAGAPMKATNLVEYFANESGRRDEFTFDYFTSEAKLFAVKSFDQKLKEVWQRRNITPNYEQTLSSIDIARNEATFTLSDGSSNTVGWDFIHVVPPMTPPKVISESSLADKEKYKGYLEVDKYTMQHKRYNNVFGLGDCVGTPIGKTAASVKSQLPVITSNLRSIIEGKEPVAKWDGYTSCPMILDVGHAMLWEFNYSLEPVTALPFQVVDPLSESALAWTMEETFLRPVYDVMLNGYTPI
ncbi:NAD(P)/FAD-dependent oxidoreductase [Vibrio sp. RC27]